MDDVTTAANLFRDGCACSQAVLGAFAARVGLDRDHAIRMAAGFAGGMRQGEVCGAVTGAYMVLGLAHGTEACTTAEGRAPVYAAVTAFAAEFRRRRGSVVCRDLLGCDISTADGLRTAQEQGLFATTCVQAVQDAAEIVEGLLPRT